MRPLGVAAPVYKQVSQVGSLPPPIGGWNAREPISGMANTDAIVLDNFIPGNGSVAVRNGYSSWATGLGSYVESLMEYSSPTANKLFAAVPTAVYDVTASGAVGAAAISTMTSGRWQHVNFATAAGFYLFMVNGADSPHYYNGSTWTDVAATITGVTPANLIGVTVHASRLWFVEKNKLSAWYLPVSAIAGAATELPVGSFCKLGGYLVAVGSWTQDGGAGMDDLFILVTSEGEVVIYSGTDPATNFSKIGTFKIPRPLGRRCIIQAGSECGIITEVGVVPLSKVLSYNLSTQATTALTDKINGAFKDYSKRGDFFGWQVLEYPKAELVIVNAPYAERVTQHQFVLNARTGAWCRFTGMNAGCWSLLGNDLYWGDNSGTVWSFDTTTYQDNSSPITAICQQAYTDLGVATTKMIKGTRPIVEGAQGFAVEVNIHTDFSTAVPTQSTLASTDTAGSVWDVAPWDTSSWEPGISPTMNWQTTSAVGKTFSPIVNLSTSNPFSMNGMDLMFEPGSYW